VDFGTKGAVNISKSHYSLLYDIFSTHIDGTASKFSNDLPCHNKTYHLVIQFASFPFCFWFKTKHTHTHRERAAQQMTTTTTTTKIKPVIGVDVDDVLTPLISHLLKFYNRKHDAQIRFEDFLSFRYHEVNIHTYINAFNPCNNKSFRFGVERKKILTRLWMNSSLAQNF
jgi:hypothetical protein